MRVAVVGLGKMGLSHLSIIRAHPDVEVAAVCDSAKYLLDVLARYTGVKIFTDFDQMLKDVELDAVVIATPSRFHAPMVRKALEHNIHVFCEKPFVLSTEEGGELTDMAEERNLVNQVGYHNRFIGTFREVKRLLDSGTVGDVSHIQAEAYGPVVLRPQTSTWRNKRTEGGGCLYDYAAHPINLVNWYFGMPTGVGGTMLAKVFSKETEDEVYASLSFAGGQTAQLSVNWSDEAYRKMTTRISIWGTKGKIFADRQEIQVYLRDTATLPEGYDLGWNVKYTTELTESVWFYVRGEEYSAQLDYFVRTIQEGLTPVNSFESALQTDSVIEMLIADAQGSGSSSAVRSQPVKVKPGNPVRRWFGLAS